MPTDFFDWIPLIPRVICVIYLDDGTIVGNQPAVLEFLHQVESMGTTFGSTPQQKKCELLLVRW